MIVSRGVEEEEQRGRRAEQYRAPLMSRPLFFSISWAWHRLIALALAVATAALYLGSARLVAGELGYPLDDAWIHQTYARNLALHGEWSFVPGMPSAGSTSPLWTLLLAVGHRLPGDPRWWTYAFGLAGLLGTAWASARLSLALFDDGRLARWIAAAVLVEWHLAWAALSGMEILLSTFLAILLLALALGRDKPRPLVWGVISGLLTLTRPEGLWLVGLVGLVLLLRSRHERPGRLVLQAGLYAVAWLAVVTPYTLVNWQLTGRLFPNTFYAKQAEYRVLIETVPLWRRLLVEAWLPWIGGQVLFLLGLGWVAARWVVRRQEVRGVYAWQSRAQRAVVGHDPHRPYFVWVLVPALWALGLVTIYALRLPVTYQHGRYLMPVIPVALVYGLWGFRTLLAGAPRLFSRSLAASAVVVFLLFWARGGVAYAEDTAIITCEMVGTARWLATATAPTDLIAAHDIGALGYFTNRPLFDLAGLVSPETIPILRDEAALLSLMQARGVTHVVIFPDWYPTMAAGPALRLILQRECPLTQAAGQESLAIYAATW